MKHVAIMLLALLGLTHAQENQDTSQAHLWLGGHMEWSQLANSNVISLGLRFAYMPTPTLSLGLWGSTLAVDASNHYKKTPQSIDYNVLGIFAERTLFRNAPVHLLIPIRLGVGGLNYAVPSKEETQSAGWFTTADCGLYAEIPVGDHFRPAIGGGLRTSWGINERGLDDSDFRTIYAGAVLKWGEFAD